MPRLDSRLYPKTTGFRKVGLHVLLLLLLTTVLGAQESHELRPLSDMLLQPLVHEADPALHLLLLSQCRLLKLLSRAPPQFRLRPNCCDSPAGVSKPLLERVEFLAERAHARTGV